MFKPKLLRENTTNLSCFPICYSRCFRAQGQFLEQIPEFVFTELKICSHCFLQLFFSDCEHLMEASLLAQLQRQDCPWGSRHRSALVILSSLALRPCLVFINQPCARSNVSSLMNFPMSSLPVLHVSSLQSLFLGCYIFLRQPVCRSAGQLSLYMLKISFRLHPHLKLLLWVKFIFSFNATLVSYTIGVQLGYYHSDCEGHSTYSIYIYSHVFREKDKFSDN